MSDTDGSVHEVINVDSPSDSDGPAIPFDGFHVVLSKPQVKKGQPLYLSARHVHRFIEPGAEKLEVYYNDEEGNEMHEWELIWSEKPKQCHIGKGWYEYCIDNGLKKGDKLSFEFDKYDGSFMLSFSRQNTVPRNVSSRGEV